MKLGASLALSLLGFLSLACGGIVSSGGGDGSHTGDTSSTSPAGGSSVAANPNACPRARPDPGQACTPPAVKSCEYGDQPTCNSWASCDDGRWSIAMPKCQAPDPAGICPADPGDIEDPSCSAEALCTFPSGVCACVKTHHGLAWMCDNPSPMCPPLRPMVGGTCTNEGQNCTYGVCDRPGGMGMTCQGGVWTRNIEPPCLPP